MIRCRMILSILLVSLITGMQVYAVDLPPSVEKLNNSSDYEAAKNAGQDICNLVNTLNENASMDIEDINWNNVYKIYVDDSDIFSLSSYSKDTIINSMDYIWCYMDEIDGRDIRVTIARAGMPSYDLVEDGVVSEEEYYALVDKAGSWTATEAEIDTEQTQEKLSSYFENAGITSVNDFILIGGTPKVRSLFAVTFTDDYADKIVPLASTWSLVSSNSNTATNTLSENSGFVVGEAYDFETVSQMLNALGDDDSVGDTGTGVEIVERSELVVVSIIAVVAVMLTILMISKNKVNANKRK